MHVVQHVLHPSPRLPVSPSPRRQVTKGLLDQIAALTAKYDERESQIAEEAKYTEETRAALLQLEADMVTREQHIVM